MALGTRLDQDGGAVEEFVMEDIDIFIIDPTYVDLDVYDLWLKGFSESEATQQRQMENSIRDEGIDCTHGIVLNDTKDQFRLFNMLEHFVQSPPMLRKQMLLQIPAEVQEQLIEKYYQFDKCVVREILGKKLTGRLRKDLDDVSEKTQVSLKSCRRQFDNIKNVFRAIEESEGGQLVDNIKKQFLLPDGQARDYACIVFMAINKFETGKRRLAHLTFDDLSFCAEQLINNWTVRADEDPEAGDTGAEFDRGFLQELRDLKVFINDREIVDEHKSLVCSHLTKKYSTKLTKVVVESNFKNLCRPLLNIAAGLIHSKDMKDIFSDFAEKFIEPCKQLDWGAKEVNAFLGSLVTTCSKLESLQRNSLHRLIPVYTRYVSVSQHCIVQMYPT